MKKRRTKTMAIKKRLFGDTYIVENDKTVTIPIERYEELIKKEAVYDELDKVYDRRLLLLAKLKKEAL
jgi:hypothetical protein